MTISSKLQEAIFSLSRYMREKSGIKSEMANMSMVQLQTLIFLAKSKASPMKDIAEYLHVELSSATSLIDHLVEMKLASRKQDKKDKRSMLVSLTKKGKDMLQKVKKQKMKRVDMLLKALSEEEKIQLLTILQKLKKHMEEYYEK